MALPSKDIVPYLLLLASASAALLSTIIPTPDIF
jgi:hypothetical protein